MAEPDAAASVAPYEGHINRYPSHTEWGVLTTDGINTIVYGGEDAARRICDPSRGDKVVFRHRFVSDWLDAPDEPAKARKEAVMSVPENPSAALVASDFTGRCHVCHLPTEHRNGQRVDGNCAHVLGQVYAVEQPGQPGKNGVERAGLVGRDVPTSTPSLPADAQGASDV